MQSQPGQKLLSVPVGVGGQGWSTMLLESSESVLRLGHLPQSARRLKSASGRDGAHAIRLSLNTKLRREIWGFIFQNLSANLRHGTRHIPPHAEGNPAPESSRKTVPFLRA